MAKLTKFKAQQVEFPTHYKVEDTNRGDAKIKNIIPAFGTIRENGTPETEEIYNGLQLGNVHTLQANKTTNLNIDYYVCNLDGLTEFGMNNDLKLRINVDAKNTNTTTKLRLNNVDYTLLKEYNGTLKQIEAGDFKPNKSYEMAYNGNQFVIINITEFGTETDTVLEGKRLAEIIGLEYGGNIQDTGSKVTGKFYYDKALKYYYECIANNNLTYNDGSKFRAISNKPLSDRLENLYESESQRIQVANGDVIFTRKGKTVTVMVRLQNDGNNITFHENQQLLEIPVKFRPTYQSYGFEAALASSSLTPGFNGATRMQINPTNITIWGAHLGRFNVLKGSATYFID
jgi:hypothetical protein|nr:MAG TPA: baseplate protein [Caudoviricetes sp.]